MPYNGSGIFIRLYNWVTDKANGIDVLASRMDAEMDGFATGLTDCVTRDGQSPALANLPMGGFKFTGLGAGSSAGDSLRYEQVFGGITNLGYQNGSPVLVTGVSTILTVGGIINDSLGEMHTSGEFVPSINGNYVLNCNLMLTAASATVMSGSAGSVLSLYKNNVLQSNLFLSWPYASGSGQLRIAFIESFVPITLLALDNVDWRVTTFFTGTAPTISGGFGTVRRMF